MIIKKFFSIISSAIIIAVLGLIWDFLFLLADFKLDKLFVEKNERFLAYIQIVMIFFSGVMFIITEVTIYTKKKHKILIKDLNLLLLLGSIIYVLLIIYIFPYSLEILYGNLPHRELAAGITILFIQISSYIAALGCFMFNFIMLCSKKNSN